MKQDIHLRAVMFVLAFTAGVVCQLLNNSFPGSRRPSM